MIIIYLRYAFIGQSFIPTEECYSAREEQRDRDGSACAAPAPGRAHRHTVHGRVETLRKIAYYTKDEITC